MKTAKIKQISLVLCCMLSLFVSSISACYCTHGDAVVQQNEQHCAPPPQSTHKEKAENHSADHHSNAASDESHHETFSETKIKSIDVSDVCCCVQLAPKNFAKSEGITIKKQSATLVAFAPIEFERVLQPQIVKTIRFVTQFYLSDSFHNLTPGRAPPVL